MARLVEGVRSDLGLKELPWDATSSAQKRLGHVPGLEGMGATGS